MRTLLRLLAVIGLACAAGLAYAQEPAPQVSLITFAPGKIYWQRFGHNALLVRAPGRAPVLYNYGVFDFNQKNFFLNFARGRMVYRLEALPADESLYFYAQEGRWAYEQVLNLNPQQARALAQFLEWNARPENAEYRYDYFIDNCSTRVRDAIDRAVDGQLRPQLESVQTGRSLRFEATRLISPDLGLALAMDLAMGPRADAELNRWQRSFVPMVLMESVRDVRIAGAPLVSYQRWLIQAADAEPAAPPSFTVLFAGIGLAFAALLAFAPWPVAARVAGALATLMGIAGLILALGWTLTEHWAMQANRNLALLSPLLLLLAVPAWRQARPGYRVSFRVRALAGAVAVAAAVVSILALLLASGQQQLQWVALWLPPLLVLCWRLLRTRSSP